MLSALDDGISDWQCHTKRHRLQILQHKAWKQKKPFCTTYFLIFWASSQLINDKQCVNSLNSVAGYELRLIKYHRVGYANVLHLVFEFSEITVWHDGQLTIGCQTYLQRSTTPLVFLQDSLLERSALHCSACAHTTMKHTAWKLKGFWCQLQTFCTITVVKIAHFNLSERSDHYLVRGGSVKPFFCPEKKKKKDWMDQMSYIRTSKSAAHRRNQLSFVFN